jgi:hypothetical protein
MPAADVEWAGLVIPNSSGVVALPTRTWTPAVKEKHAEQN